VFEAVKAIEGDSEDEYFNKFAPDTDPSLWVICLKSLPFYLSRSRLH